MKTRIDSLIPWIAWLILPLVAFPQTAPPAAKLTGDWQAVLTVGQQSLRLLLHVAHAETNWSASLDSLDQGAFALAVDAIRIDPAHLRFEMNGIGARFDGAWNSATLQFEGQWQQGGATFPLQWKQSASAAAKSPGPTLLPEDRDYLVAYLRKTQDDLLRSLAGLTPAQWNWQPDASRWSIAQCVEHLLIEEQTLFPAVTRQIVRAPLPEGQPRAGREQDERIIRYLTDRTSKVAAAESMQPRGNLATPAEGIAQFAKWRGETIDWVRGTKEDLRGHGTTNPTFQFIDAYGYFLILAAHSARHTAQIDEVKNTPGYPK